MPNQLSLCTFGLFVKSFLFLFVCRFFFVVVVFFVVFFCFIFCFLFYRTLI